jgi:hypothetical protein
MAKTTRNRDVTLGDRRAAMRAAALRALAFAKANPGVVRPRAEWRRLIG